MLYNKLVELLSIFFSIINYIEISKFWFDKRRWFMSGLRIFMKVSVFDKER